MALIVVVVVFVSYILFVFVLEQKVNTSQFTFIRKELPRCLNPS